MAQYNCVDAPCHDLKDCEVKAMNDNYRKEQRFWVQEHSHRVVI